MYIVLFFLYTEFVAYHEYKKKKNQHSSIKVINVNVYGKNEDIHITWNATFESDNVGEVGNGILSYGEKSALVKKG